MKRIEMIRSMPEEKLANWLLWVILTHCFHSPREIIEWFEEEVDDG